MNRDVGKSRFRNEQAYFTSIMSIMQHITPSQSPVTQPLLSSGSATEGKLYLIGDSHSMSPSWQTINIQGKPTLIVNKLITGLKIWHLRDVCNFYTKKQFENAMRNVPRGADVMFMFGEIDCREGMMNSVAKGYHKDMAECQDQL